MIIVQKLILKVVFTHELTLGQKLKSFLKEKGIFYRERKRNNLKDMILIESKGEFLNNKWNRTIKRVKRQVYFLKMMKSQMRK